MALALAVFALAAIGATVAGSLMLGVLEQQSGRTILYLAQAAEAAEAQLQGSITSATLHALPAGAPPLDLGPLSPSPEVTVERHVSRLGHNLFLIRARGTRVDAGGGTLASRAAGLLVRVVPDSLTGAERLVPVPRGWLQLY